MGEKGGTVRGSSHAAVERGTFYKGKRFGTKIEYHNSMVPAKQAVSGESIRTPEQNGDDNYMTCSAHRERYDPNLAFRLIRPSVTEVSTYKDKQ